ncbi:hypothetical protein QN277_026589 [Acacia crassicarpa]|uniref:Uncharacterized protein n=1 Tax=Acacia crassicarpa TaxID=499986 RepID=A0AAE1MHY7_9FABA|nr:hypothetical protein QN277_026589 [Acacia crassicarpa]
MYNYGLLPYIFRYLARVCSVALYPHLTRHTGSTSSIQLVGALLFSDTPPEQITKCYVSRSRFGVLINSSGGI